MTSVITESRCVGCVIFAPMTSAHCSTKPLRGLVPEVQNVRHDFLLKPVYFKEHLHANGQQLTSCQRLLQRRMPQIVRRPLTNLASGTQSVQLGETKFLFRERKPKERNPGNKRGNRGQAVTMKKPGTVGNPERPPRKCDLPDIGCSRCPSSTDVHRTRLPSAQRGKPDLR